MGKAGEIAFWGTVVLAAGVDITWALDVGAEQTDQIMCRDFADDPATAENYGRTPQEMRQHCAKDDEGTIAMDDSVEDGAALVALPIAAAGCVRALRKPRN